MSDDIITRYKTLLKKKEEARIFVETTKSKIQDKQKDIIVLRSRMQEKYGTSNYESLKIKRDEHVKNLTIMVENAEKALQ